jgi:hypothetical protein
MTPFYAFQSSGLEVFIADKLISIEYNTGASPFRGATELREFIAPSLEQTPSSGTYLFSESKIKNVVVGKIKSMSLFANKTTTTNLRNVTIGQDTDANISFNFWTAANVIKEGDVSVQELNSNLYNNLLTKLYDHSEDGEERTLRLGWYNYVSEENKLYAKNKGWNITT